MSAIQDEMTRERANALKEQEENLAAMLAELQMAKAKEVPLNYTSLLFLLENVVFSMLRFYVDGTHRRATKSNIQPQIQSHG